MIGSRFDQLASIEVAGVKAQLQEKVKEADAAIREMRELAITLADPLLKHGMSLGRWSQGLNLVEAKEFQDSIDGVLQRLEVPNETRAKLRRHYEYFTLIDLCQISAKSVQMSMLEQEQEERSDIAKRFGSPVSDHAGHNAAWEQFKERQRRREELVAMLMLSEKGAFPDPSGFERELQRSEVLSPERKASLLDAIKEDLAFAKEFAATRVITDPAGVLRRYQERRKL